MDKFRIPGYSTRNGPLPALLLVLLVAFPLLCVGTAAASAPVSYGKTVGTGVFGVPYAETSNLSFPYSFPSFGAGPLQDGDLVYDTQVSFEIVNPNPTGASFLVVTETWTPGTQQVLENVTGPNGTYRLEPVTIPARLDASWSNSTVNAAPYSSGTVTVPLRFDAQPRPLEVRVGTATWELQHLTPATSSVAGVYTSGGIWVFGLLMAVVTLAAVLAGLWVAKGLAVRLGRTPPVPFWWPAGWIAVPLAWFFTGYVSFNQVLGSVSPLVLPLPMVVAIVPYLPRLFTKFFDQAELEGLEAVTLDSASNPKIILPVVRHQGGLKCAPQTWREALWSHWVGLPEIRGYEVTLLGGKVRVQPRLVPVSCPLDGYYRAEATASGWFDARAGVRRPRHRFLWSTERSESTFAPDGVTQTGTKTRRRLSPHIEAGYLEGTFPPKDSVAKELAGVRSAEVEAHDNEVDRIENADLRGTLLHRSRTYATDSVRAHEEAAARQDQPRSREEIERLVERNRRNRSGVHDEHDAEAKNR